MPDDLTGAAAASAPPAASATPPSPAPVSAERAASDVGDFGAFDRAHVAKKQGKSVPQVAASAPVQPVAEAPDTEAPASTPPTGERPVSRRQQAINDYERRIAEQGQRIQELEHRMARPSAPGPDAGQQPPAPPQETQKQRVARYLGLPDAPKVDDYDTYPEFNAAQTLFLQDKLRAEDHAVQSRQQQQEHRLHAMAARDESFRERLTAAKTADPGFVTGLSDEAKQLGGIDHALRSGRQPGPVNIIGELVYDSPHAVAFLRHISADPSALQALVTPPESLQRLPPQWRAKAHIDHLVTEFRRLEGRLAYEDALAARDGAAGDAPAPVTSVSSAPPPPPTLGKAGRSTDPVRSALARNDFTAFDQAEQARRVARRAGRAG